LDLNRSCKYFLIYGYRITTNVENLVCLNVSTRISSIRTDDEKSAV